MKVIGRRELIDLPEFGLQNIQAKIDTGAYGCAIHCHKMKVVEKEGKQVLQFQLLDPSHPEYEDKNYHTAHFREKKVKNSGGFVEERFVIQSTVRIFQKEYKTEFSLTNRKRMKHPVLIGRKFLRKKFLVDVSLKNLSLKSSK